MALPFFKKTKKNTKVQKNEQNTQEEAIKKFSRGLASIKDIIAPPSIEVDFTYLKIGQNYFRTLFVAGYPRFVNANWLAQLINFNHTLDVVLRDIKYGNDFIVRQASFWTKET